MKKVKSNNLLLLLEVITISGFSGFMFELIDSKQIQLSGIIIGALFGVGFWVMELFWSHKWKALLLKLPVLFSIFVKAFIFLIIIIIFTGTIGFVMGYFEGRHIDEFFSTRIEIGQIIVYIYVLQLYLFLSFYMQLKHFFGQDTLFNFLLGKYSKPVKEHIIFIFLDMKSSTTLAEKLGLESYYELLSDFFNDITDPVYFANAEVYQYVGDEVVFTWETDKGINNQNCIKLFFGIKKKVKSREQYYLEKYGEIPRFKAAVHLGDVISAQIGEVKRELIYNGDVLNTTARMQEQCNIFGQELIVSGHLLKALNLEDNYTSDKLDTIQLRGKERLVHLFGIKETLSLV
jgi:adenylate cyclase